jgi:hypothetical protein
VVTRKGRLTISTMFSVRESSFVKGRRKSYRTERNRNGGSTRVLSLEETGGIVLMIIGRHTCRPPTILEMITLAISVSYKGGE